MATQIARIEGAAARLPASPDNGFSLHGLQIFTSIPAHHHGIVALRGMVVVYDTDSIGREGILEGGYYVREHQYPPGRSLMEDWHRRELERAYGKAQPFAKLITSREVVQAIRWPHGDGWAVRLASGYVDGPYHDWAWGTDFIGKVAGIYLPQGREVQQ